MSISNTAAEAVDVISIELTGTDAGLFEVEASSFTVPSAGSHDLEIYFIPDRVGSFTASLDFVCDGEAVSVALRGAGIPLLVAVIPVDAPVAGSNLNLTATLPERYLPDTQDLFYRQTGQATYRSTPFTLEGTRLEAAIPAEEVTPRGIEYYLRFVRGENVLTVPGTNPESNPIPLRVQVEQLESEIDLPPLTYRMVSVPLQLDDPDPVKQLADDFGAYDSTLWRLFRWDPVRQAYADPPALTTTFIPGTAFWLSVRSGGGFDTGAGRSVSPAPPYSLELLPGWNQIGSPYPFVVAWANVAGSDQLEAPVYYDGNEYQYGRSVLEPWKGYFVYNPTAEPIDLSFSPVETDAAPAATDKRGEGVPVFLKHLLQAGSFVVQMMVEVSDHNLRETQNYVGLVDQSRTDALEIREAPPVGPHVRLSIMEEGEPLAGSFKPFGAGGQLWEVEISSMPPAEVLPRRRLAKIRLVEHGARPAGYDVSVVDAESGDELTLEQDAFTLVLPPRRSVRRLRVVVGTADFAEHHSDINVRELAETALYQNYPNPFYPTTVIGYALEERVDVELGIYDVLGRRVRTLVRGKQDNGRYDVEWDGRDDFGVPLASGVYVYRLRAGGVVHARPMLLLP